MFKINSIRKVIQHFRQNKIYKDLIVGVDKKIIMSVDIINNDISYIFFVKNVAYSGSDDFEDILTQYENYKD